MEIITTSAQQTKHLAKDFSLKLRGGEIICLSGELGAGKTTFAQGLLKELGVQGPYTSPTFAILKEYKSEAKGGIRAIYHIDAYRITAKDLLALGWKDFAGKSDVVTIIEWAERTKKIIPKNSFWIRFDWIDEKKRSIVIE